MVSFLFKCRVLNNGAQSFKNISIKGGSYQRESNETIVY
ncbi:hypothetical protein SHOMR1_1063 [Staphylococcus hominis]|nr:hypothetical protein SHOMR1_1063 [Staphylococcus hominis]